MVKRKIVFRRKKRENRLSMLLVTMVVLMVLAGGVGGRDPDPLGVFRELNAERRPPPDEAAFAFELLGQTIVRITRPLAGFSFAWQQVSQPPSVFSNQ